MKNNSEADAIRKEMNRVSQMVSKILCDISIQGQEAVKAVSLGAPITAANAFKVWAKDAIFKLATCVDDADVLWAPKGENKS